MLSKLRIVLTVAIVLAAGYSAWTFFSRWQQAKSFEKTQEQNADQRAKDDMKLIGTDRLKISNFYGPRVVKRNEPFQLCYSMVYAKAAKLEPPLVEVTPSFSKCTDDIKIVKTTEFKLTGTDAAGASVTETFTVEVR